MQMPNWPPQVQAVKMTPPPASFPLAAYVQGLKGKNIGADEILRVLQTCYDGGEEEETVVANKVEATKDF
jgi:hypothetical protein